MSGINVVSCDLEADPFQDIDDDADNDALQGLINDVQWMQCTGLYEW